MHVIVQVKSIQEVANGRINTSLAYYCNKLVLPSDKVHASGSSVLLSARLTHPRLLRQNGVDFTY